MNGEKLIYKMFKMYITPNFAQNRLIECNDLSLH